MGLVSQSIKNMKGGVSQQPEILRYPEQGSEQINGWSSETNGLQKRPPSVFIKSLLPKESLGDAPLVHLINRDSTEQYYMIFTGQVGEGVYVYDLQGNKKLVIGADVYLKNVNPREDLKVITVADNTFVVNKKQVVGENPALSDGGTYAPLGRAIIVVRGGQYGKRITVSLNGGPTVQHDLPNGSNPTDVANLSANTIAIKIRDLLVAAYPTWNFTIGTDGDYIVATAPAGVTIIKMNISDGFNNQLVSGFVNEVQTFSKLPSSAPNGYKVRISGETNKTADAYYVMYDEVGRVWKETVGWNIRLGLNASTMPRRIVRLANGNFQVQVMPLDNRVAGDNDTNPMPSLSGQTINDIFFYRNRLGFLSGENIVMSRAGKYFNFFPNSVATIGDDDPIDVAISHNRVNILKFAVPFNEELLVWSDQAQFTVRSTGVLTARSIELNLCTEFDVSDMARPFGLGRGIYFAAPRSTFTSIKRYYAVQDVTAVKSAEDISSHIPNYIQNGVYSIQGSGTENFITVLTSGKEDRIYLYKFLYVEEQLKQQSWSYWSFGNNIKIMAAACIGSTMYILAQNDFNIYLERIDFLRSTTDFPIESQLFRMYGDHKITYTVKNSDWDIDRGTTRINLSTLYNLGITKGTVYVMVTDFQESKVYSNTRGDWDVNPNFEVPIDLRNSEVVIGWAIDFQYTFSQFLIKKLGDDGSVVTEDIGRVQLRRAWVNYENSGAFTILNTYSKRKDVFTYNMSGIRLASESSRLGDPPIDTSQFRFPVYGNALQNTVTITSDHATPLSIIGCGWEGNYMRRSSGI